MTYLLVRTYISTYHTYLGVGITLARGTRHSTVASSVLQYRNCDFLKKKSSRNATVFVYISGMSGDVAINSEGNRIPVFVFSNRQNGRLIPIAAIDQTKPNNESVTVYNVTTVWPNGVKIVPRDAPKCGFQGEKCLNTPEGKTEI